MTSGTQPQGTAFSSNVTIKVLAVIEASHGHDFHRIDVMNKLTEPRFQVEVWRQSLVAAGMLRFQINDDGDIELQLGSRGTYLFGDLDVLD